MLPKWNAALALLTLTSLLAACSSPGVKTGVQNGPTAAHETAAVSPAPSAAASAAPKASPSPSASPTPHASPSPSPSPSPTAAPSASPPASPEASATPKAAATAKPAAASTKPAASTPQGKELSWYFVRPKTAGVVPGFPAETKQFTAAQKVVYVGTGKKVYLTFDTGGPLGDVDKLLTTLKNNNVKAAFFLAGYNIRAHPDFLKRLVNDGHVVANHTMTHTDMTTQSDAQVEKEIKDFETMYLDITGKPVPKVFRFPYGKYSMHLLDEVSGMGYTSVFWSSAYHDWEPRPGGADEAYTDVMKDLHNGDIILLHQGSEDNINALDRIIKGIKQEGYEFGVLTDLVK